MDQRGGAVVTGRIITLDDGHSGTINRHVGGWRPPAPHHLAARLKLSKYLNLSTLPMPPAGTDWRPAAMAALLQMYLNDQIGDCFVAFLFHLLGVWTGNASGTPLLATPEQVVAIYSGISGYDPNAPLAPDGSNPTDVGCDEATGLLWANQHGLPLGGCKSLTPISIDPRNQGEVMAAIWLLGGVGWGTTIPDAWLSAKVWSPGTPNPANGHAFGSFSYDGAGVSISTWGEVDIEMPWASTVSNVANVEGGQCWGVLSDDWIDSVSQKAPSGFDLDQLTDDLATLSQMQMAA